MYHGLHHASDANHPEINLGLQQTFGAYLYCLLESPSTEGSGQNFLKSVAGVMCWPVGWAIVHIATMAGLQALQPPSLNAQLGELLLSFGALAVVCLWMVVGTIGAPKLIANAVTSGTNFATGMVGGFTSAAGQHAARGLQAGTAVGGALVGGAYAGPAGAVAGASLGVAMRRRTGFTPDLCYRERGRH